MWYNSLIENANNGEKRIHTSMKPSKGTLFFTNNSNKNANINNKQQCRNILTTQDKNETVFKSHFISLHNDVCADETKYQRTYFRKYRF
jgi:hypothetical protein